MAFAFTVLGCQKNRQQRLILCLFFCAFFQNATPTFAANITAQTTIEQIGTFDSNPMMLSSGAKSIFGSTTSPELIITDKTPTASIQTQVTINANLFDRSEYNSTDIHADTRLEKHNARWSASINQTTNYDTTRTSELTSVGTNIQNSRHLGLTEASAISYSPTASDKINLSGSVQTSRYEKTTYTNYNVYTVEPSWTHGFNSLNSGVVDLIAQRYQTANGTSYTNDSIGPSFGWLATLSQRLSMKLQGGVQASKETQSGISGKWIWQNVYSSNLTYKGIQDSTNLQASRSQQPYSNGSGSLLTTISLSNTHTISPRLDFVTMVSVQQTGYTRTTNANLENLYKGRTGLTYHATDKIDLSGNYSYQRKNLTNNGGTATENTALLSCAFHPLAITVK